MAAAEKAPKKSTMAVIVGHEMHTFDAVSMGGDSGWRDVDPERVAELVQMIMDGSWGATSLAGPSLVAESGKK